MKNRYLGLAFSSIFLFLLIISTNSCKDDDKGTPQDSIYIYIDEVMNSWYYWYQEVPEVDIFQYDEPGDLLEDLIYKPVDKWSFVAETESLDALFEEGETFGFGFLFRFDAAGTLHVIFVYENSDAYTQGIRKGNIVQRINGTEAKYFDNFEAFFDESPATWTFELLDNNAEYQVLTITKSTIVQNAVFATEKFANIGGKRVGYLAYGDFLGYGKPELEEAFAYFKSIQVDELIVDLRYNTGGYISLAEQMAEMIAPSSVVNQTFVTFSHNDLVAPYQDTTILFAEHELNLNLERIFFITTEFSASASELVINSLEPYMEVYLIGSNTHGKPVGMYGFSFQEWTLYPVTVKLLNADGFGDFFDGLPVDAVAEEGLDKDWGDESDPNISQALYFIENGSFDKSIIAAEKSRSTDYLSRKLLSAKNLVLLDR
jgi:carboxyl-terminal processing protease